MVASASSWLVSAWNPERRLHGLVYWCSSAQFCMPGSILRPNGSTSGFGFILTGTKRAAATGGHNIIPTPPPPPPLRYTWCLEWVRQQSRLRKMAQSASMNAYQRSSAEIWMQLQQEFAEVEVMHDEGSSFSDWEDASSNTGHR